MNAVVMMHAYYHGILPLILCCTQSKFAASLQNTRVTLDSGFDNTVTHVKITGVFYFTAPKYDTHVTLTCVSMQWYT